MAVGQYIATLLSAIEQLKATALFWKTRALEMEREVAMLKNTIAQQNIKKDSSNSSIPPSMDIAKRNQSLRQPSGKKRGGQKGHPGTTLEMSSTPESVINLETPCYCQQCGNDLRAIPVNLHRSYQVVDVPQPKPMYTEYRQYARQCSCGHLQASTLPTRVTNTIQYGENVQAITAYESVRQYVPVKRLTETFQSLYQLSISGGTICNILASMAAKAKPVMEVLEQMLAESTIAVGGDETSVSVGGQKHWAWVYQNLYITVINIFATRGKVAVNTMFPDGFRNAILVSDRWRAHLSTKAKGHQLCIAHLLRECNYLAHLEKTAWIDKLKAMFLEALELKRTMTDYSPRNAQVLAIESGFSLLLLESLDETQTPKTVVMQKAMIKHQSYIFSFLHHIDVPPDNNGSERAVRNFKVKTKISGKFNGGQDSYAVLRSVIDTTIKNGGDVMRVLAIIASLPLPVEE